MLIDTPYKLIDFFPDCVLPDCELTQKESLKTHQHILPKQLDILNSNANYLYCQGGVGSAKSVAFAVKCVYLSLVVPENVGVVVRKDFKLLYKSSWLDIKKTIKRLVQKDIIPQPKYSDKRQGDYTTIEFHNNSIIYAMQAKNWSEGLGASYGWFWVDDAMETDEEMFVGDETNAGLISRVRLPHVRYFKQITDNKPVITNMLHGMVSSNPPPVGHWLHKLFGNKPGNHNIGDEQIEWIQISTHENPFVGADYAKGLMSIQNKMGRSTNTARRVIFGESIPAYGGIKVFPQFEHTVHVSDTNYNKDIPIIRGWDFGFHHPAVVFSHMYTCDHKMNHYFALSEVADVFAADVWQLYTKVKEHTDALYKDCCMILDAGDRAGERQSDSNRDRRGPIRILRDEYKLAFKHRYLFLANSLEYMRKLLKTKCDCGKEMIQVSNQCPVLIGALEGGYKYPKARNGKIGDKPVEDRYFADIACAWRYGAENFIKWGVPYTYIQQATTPRPKPAKPWDWMELSPADMAKVLTR